MLTKPCYLFLSDTSDLQSQPTTNIRTYNIELNIISPPVPRSTCLFIRLACSPGLPIVTLKTTRLYLTITIRLYLTKQQDYTLYLNWGTIKILMMKVDLDLTRFWHKSCEFPDYVASFPLLLSLNYEHKQCISFNRNRK